MSAPLRLTGLLGVTLASAALDLVDTKLVIIDRAGAAKRRTHGPGP